jgi:hypothetical protein
MPRVRVVPAYGQVTVEINGMFDRPAEAVSEIIDNALHDAGLCGCAGPANGYVLSMKSRTTSDRHARSKDHEGREAARAWIAVGAGSSNGSEGVRPATNDG